MSGLLQDEAEGYECQRLSKWFASRIDARVVVRKYHKRNHMKPIVHYKTYSDPVMCLLYDSMDKPFWCARLEAVDHPHIGSGTIRTSEIVSFNPHGGIIETRNTIYVPEL